MTTIRELADELQIDVETIGIYVQQLIDIDGTAAIVSDRQALTARPCPTRRAVSSAPKCG